jgi:hypothetical protein
MQCAGCGWPVAEARTESAHVTSEGWVRYRRCVCGAVFVELPTGATPGTANGTRAR